MSQVEISLRLKMMTVRSKGQSSQNDGTKKYTVYRHISPNGKAYVGITSVKPERRWDCGNGYQNNPYFFRAINKYGWNNFQHEIIFENLTKQQAECAERLLIGYWDLTNHNNGYNISHGGSTVGKHSEKSKYKNMMSQSTRCPVMQIDKDTNEILAIYRSTGEAERKTGVNRGGISACMKNKVHHAGNYIWKEFILW